MQVMHDDDNNITIIMLYQSFGFMSPAEGLHFSALVIPVDVMRMRAHSPCVRK